MWTSQSFTTIYENIRSLKPNLKKQANIKYSIKCESPKVKQWLLDCKKFFKRVNPRQKKAVK